MITNESLLDSTIGVTTTLDIISQSDNGLVDAFSSSENFQIFESELESNCYRLSIVLEFWQSLLISHSRRLELYNELMSVLDRQISSYFSSTKNLRQEISSYIHQVLVECIDEEITYEIGDMLSVCYNFRLVHTGDSL